MTFPWTSLGITEQESIGCYYSVVFRQHCYGSHRSICHHTWYGEHEQAVLLTDLLFKSTKARHAGQDKCSLQQWRSVDENKKAGNAIETLREIKVQEFYPNIYTLLLTLATLPFATTSAERTFICLNAWKHTTEHGLRRIFSKGGKKWIFPGVDKNIFPGAQKWQNFILPTRNYKNDIFC